MKRIMVLSVLVGFTLLVLTAPMAMAAKYGKSKWPIKVEYVTFVDRNHLTVKLFKENWKEVEKRSQGKLKFNYRGGPESIKIFAQAMAVYKGATDMVLTTPSFMGKLIKGSSMLTLCQTPVADHVKSGLYDYMNEVFNEANMQFIQMYPRETGTAFIMLAKDPINSVADFKGKVVRGGDYMDAVAPLLGMTTVSLKHFEEYSALERGMIDIGRMTVESMMKFRLYEVSKHLILPSIGSAPMSWFMNLDKWNEIPPDLQQMIIDTLYELAPQTQAKTKEIIDDYYKKLTSQPGVTVTEFTGKDKEVYIDQAEKAMYEYYLKENPPVAKKIYELTHTK